MRCTCGHPVLDVLDDMTCDCARADLDSRREHHSLRWVAGALLDAKDNEAGVEEMEERWTALRLTLDKEAI